MHVIYRKQNYKNIELTRDNPGETVGVLRRDGKIEQRRWLGLITRTDARESNGKSVKLKISRVDGYDLKEGEYVQGCLIERGVYAVVDTTITIISNHTANQVNSG